MDMLSRMEPSFATVFEFTTMGMAIISLNGQWMKINTSLCTYTRLFARRIITIPYN